MFFRVERVEDFVQLTHVGVQAPPHACFCPQLRVDCGWLTRFVSFLLRPVRTVPTVVSCFYFLSVDTTSAMCSALQCGRLRRHCFRQVASCSASVFIAPVIPIFEHPSSLPNPHSPFLHIPYVFAEAHCRTNYVE